jgi:hypothetical protein
MEQTLSVVEMRLTAPLFTDWQEQYVRVIVPGVAPGAPLALTIDGAPAPVQFTGHAADGGAEVLVRLGFAQGQTRTLVFSAGNATTDLTRRPLPLDGETTIGQPGRALRVSATAPFAGFAGRAMASAIVCETAFLGATLAQTNDGPLFTDYALDYAYAEERGYTLTFRCYKDAPYVEVAERFSLGMNAELTWTLNPTRAFTHIISRDSFEGDSQPTVEPLGAEHPRDVLCRLQMPVLSEYFIPNNRGWFAFFDDRNEAAGMVGVLGLYGAKWEEPVANMPELFDRDATVAWVSSLASGTRHWLLYAGPVEKDYTPERRFVFHRLHGEFNALRLDEHLDLDGGTAFDAACAHTPGIFAAGDFHADARQRAARYPCIAEVLASPSDWLRANGSMHLASLAYLLEPTAEHAEALYALLLARFERWVRQFQGWRTGENDYMKNVIGFTRYLRGMLIAYEQLRRDDVLSEAQVNRMNAYFAFAARRILDEGRWPHSRTWKHPDHPESSRDFYAYGGEHKPDRLVWTNCLPNFQSDPMCALAHLSALFTDHPDADFWRRFALDDIDRQLDAYCGVSGAWEESINYALYTFSYFVITFKAVKARWGIDYFNDARVRRYAGWLCHFFGPYDTRFDAYTWPAIGNAVLPQDQAEYLLCYATELADDDPLRADCLAIWQRTASRCRPSEHYPVMLAATAPLDAIPDLPLRPLSSEVMDEVGVSMRDRHTAPGESYLFQKIGFAKDHYEGDESAFNWYAKGTPLLMDYGTYTGDIGIFGAHNLVEIPDEDPLRRGYLADHLFSPALDYTRCELPVTLKLLWGRVRSFEEIENKDGKIDRRTTPYFYIGDRNPVGPKLWKVRQLLFVKPDYLVLFDRVYGRIPHRYNLHVTGTGLRRDGAYLTAAGRYDLDLLAFVQHPADFTMETGEIVPKLNAPDEVRARHAQHYFRLYNTTDGIYRTVLFAQERGRAVTIDGVGEHGLRIVTEAYTDYVFVHNDFITVRGEGVAFNGRAGWIRRTADGQVQASVPDGEMIEAFGVRITGRGPWTYADGAVTLHGGAPRRVTIS